MGNASLSGMPDGACQTGIWAGFLSGVGTDPAQMVAVAVRAPDLGGIRVRWSSALAALGALTVRDVG
jgi:hypothetical protein